MQKVIFLILFLVFGWTANAVKSEGEHIVAAHVSNRLNALKPHKDSSKMVKALHLRLSKAEQAYLKKRLAGVKALPRFRSAGNTVIVSYAGGAYDVVIENLKHGAFSVKGTEFRWNKMESLQSNLARLEGISGRSPAAQIGAQLIVATSYLDKAR